MKTVIAYFDETGDDGFVNSSSDDFVLTSIYTKTTSWQKNYNAMKNCRALLKEKYGFHSTVEMHTKNFLTDKNPYRNYGWTKEQKQEILIAYTKCIAEQMDFSCVNVIIDKTKITDSSYNILEKDSAESYFIQICDFISYFVHLYFKCVMNGKPLPSRVATVIDNQFVSRVMTTLRYYGRLNLKASKTNEFGLVIYPK